MEIENNAYFWQKIDTLFYSSFLDIKRLKGSKHPVYKSLIYPVDYGYLNDTVGEANHGIAVFKGTSTNTVVDTLIIAADILKKDIETKLLLSCTKQEELEILEFLNQSDFQKTIVIRRTNYIPSWGCSNN